MPFFDSSKIGFKVRLFALQVRREKDVIKIRAKFKVIDLILCILIIMRLLKLLLFFELGLICFILIILSFSNEL